MTRPKESIEVLLAKGVSNINKEDIARRREEEAALKPNNNKTDVPDWLTDKIARKEYRRIAKELTELNLLSNLDVTTLAQYCAAYVNYLNVSKEMEGQPFVVPMVNKTGATNMVKNPLISIQQQYAIEMQKYSIQMGLTIQSRLKMTPPKPEEKPKGKFDEFV
ncbi:phage terminase small subunit P27 family [Paenibacillus sp. 19GGS1-52]|uniref:phage terminase small subunit P27 family n=1 Tax=Paenibacillus sp. 19GGS1-52 TaxID=2758563 RepID=UPI001EFA32FA|nr:phage terminase small subunit P27 family [Paenibacillus sp. 19GGS1-52]ULO09661.1 phage terminase small subunit P27 family [Paenibacillus sp. 19GGS1-52]